MMEDTAITRKPRFCGDRLTIRPRFSSRILNGYREYSTQGKNTRTAYLTPAAENADENRAERENRQGMLTPSARHVLYVCPMCEICFWAILSIIIFQFHFDSAQFGNLTERLL